MAKREPGRVSGTGERGATSTGGITTRHLTLIKGERDQQRGFLSLSEAATWAGVSKRTVRRWVEKGLPYYQGSERGKVLLRPGDIETFLNRKQATQVDLSSMVNEVFTTLAKKGAA